MDKSAKSHIQLGIQTDRLKPSFTSFIQRQPMFFVATAAPEGRVNMSPKGLDSLRVISESKMQMVRSRAETELEPWYGEMKSAQMMAFWKKKNLCSIDGFDTALLPDKV